MIITIGTADALTSLKPNAQWVLRNDELEWLDATQTQPTEAEITAEISRLQAEYASKQYQRDRQYAPTGDQLDMLWHSIDAGEFGNTAKQSEFYTANKAVKDANPKG
jgi:uncharacterized small protein (DUF1192 family)